MTQAAQHIIVLRFSAIGDVLMTVPVIDAVARQYPDMRITVVSRSWARPIFGLLPKNVSFVPADFEGSYRGFRGLNRLCRRLFALHPTAIADLHDVLRTQWLRLRFRLLLNHVRVASVRKNRRSRRAFITAAVKEQQQPVFEKYADVFARLGYPVQLDYQPLALIDKRTALAQIPRFNAALRPETNWVGIAPFAAHQGKIYPLPLMEQVVALLSRRKDTRIFLFGAGHNEADILQAWALKYPRTESMAGVLDNMGQELALISQLRVMLSMDSANMHLAALAGTRVVSVWGATHPLGGFLGWGQRMADVVQLPDLHCRPCSTYGNAPCRFGNYPCLNDITPEEIVKKLED